MSRLVGVAVAIGTTVLVAGSTTAAGDDSSCGSLSWTCGHPGSFGIRFGLETRTVPAALRASEDDLDGIGYRVDTRDSSLVTGMSSAIFWNPIPWFYAGGDFAILFGPGRSGDRATTTDPRLVVEPGPTVWARLAGVAGGRFPVGRLWVGGELLAGPSVTGVVSEVKLMGEVQESASTESWSWRVEPRATVLWPLATGNLELYVGGDRGRATSSISLGINYSLSRLPGQGHRHR